MIAARAEQHNHVATALSFIMVSSVVNHNTITEHTTNEKSHVARIGSYMDNEYVGGVRQQEFISWDWKIKEQGPKI